MIQNDNIHRWIKTRFPFNVYVFEGFPFSLTVTFTAFLLLYFTYIQIEKKGIIKRKKKKKKRDYVLEK